tara:strand:+ start:131 stop:454 length:324 start_codon:yes stop_codon:yes gene_type:complete
MSDSRLYLFATIRPKPEFFEAARAALDELVPLTMLEPGCHVFSAFISRDEPNSLHLFECFEDEAALTRHYEKPYTIEVFKKYEGWLAAPVEVRKLSASSAASAGQFR